MKAITSIPTSSIHPNDYNPNAMEPDAFDELVKEVRHLGRIPKPVVVRPNGDGYTIVDGEHGWRAAREVGMSEVPREVSEVDDFEARRQTYKRNQHGEHNPVLLGRMFRQMMEQRGLSGRALAEEIDISEGTVRNALIYADAEQVRNCYAGEDRTAEISALSVRGVRTYLALPEGIRDPWLTAGADASALLEAGTFTVNGEKIFVDRPEDRGALVSAGLHEPLKAFPFSYARELWIVREHLERASSVLPGLVDYIKPLIQAGYNADIVVGCVPVRSKDGRWQFVATPERWAEIVNEADARANAAGSDFLAITQAMIRLELKGRGEDHDLTDPRVIECYERLKDGPDYVRLSSIIALEDKLKLADAVAALPQDIRDRVGPEAVKTLEARDGWMTATADEVEDITGDAISAAAVGSIKERWASLTVQDAVDSAVSEIRREQATERSSERSNELRPLVDAVVSEMAQHHSISTGHIGKLHALTVLRRRLEAVPAPELRLMVALMTGEPATADVWLSAAEKDEARKGGAA